MFLVSTSHILHLLVPVDYLELKLLKVKVRF